MDDEGDTDARPDLTLLEGSANLNGTPPKSRYRLLTTEQVQARPDPVWLIDDFFAVQSLAAIVGPSASYKSFLALSIAGSVASGLDWHGHRVRKSPVVYVFAEGTAGLKRRVQVWQHWHKVETMPCFFLPEAVPMHEPDMVAALKTAIDTLPDPPGLIVLDTLARCMVGGDENSTRDMGFFVEGTDALRRATGATVLTAHHVGKSGDTRGSTAFTAAMDTILQVKRDDSRLTLTCGKQKDAAEFAPLALERRIVELERGGSSLVFEPADYQPPVPKADAGRATQDEMLGILLSLGPDGARAKAWQQACSEQGIVQERGFYKQKAQLLQAGRVTLEGDTYRCQTEAD